MRRLCARALRRHRGGRCGESRTRQDLPASGFSGVETLRGNGDADIGFEQFDQISLRGDAMAVLHINAVAAKRRAQLLRMFAISSREQLLRL